MAIGGTRAALLVASALTLGLGSGVHTRDALASDVQKTLARAHDPVVVPGAQLASLPSHLRETAKLRLHRFEAGRSVPIPHQFDQRDADGDVVVAGPRDFAFDANDELVFMAKDAGDRTIADPCPTPCDAALEIQVDDPRSGESAWVYLAAYADPQPIPDFEPYVTFDLERREARSPSYRVQYAPARNYFTGLSVGEVAGGTNVNLLRQSRMRGSPTFSLLVTDFTLDFTEQSTIIEIDGVRSGPVRAVRRARLSVELGALFPELPSGLAYTYHYATSYVTPTRVSFPWIMLKTLRDFRFEGVLDFQPDAMPMRYYDAANPDGVSLSAGGSEIRTSEDHDWWVHSGDAGTVLHALVIPERWREWGVVRGAVVRPGNRRAASIADHALGDGHSGAASGPEIGVASAEASVAAEAPSDGAAGYTLLHMTNLQEAGSWDLMMASVVLPAPFRAGDEAAPMAMLRDPLETRVRRVR